MFLDLENEIKEVSESYFEENDSSKIKGQQLKT